MRSSIKKAFFPGIFGFITAFLTIYGAVSADEKNYTIATGNDPLHAYDHMNYGLPILQPSTPGTQQHGNLNIEGFGLFGDGVGIGTDTPTSTLEVLGAGTTSASSSLNITDSNSSSLLFVRDDGNVGIGTAMPGTGLEVIGTVTATAFAGDGSALTGISGGSSDFTNGGDTAGADRTLGNLDDFNLNIITDGTTSVYIGKDQQIGLGTTDVGADLGASERMVFYHPANVWIVGKTSNGTMEIGVDSEGSAVVGTLSANDFTIRTGNTEYMRIKYLSGNVGIGTKTPSAQLHTTGSVRFSNFGAGTMQTDSNGNVSVSSDIRLKNVTGKFERGLSEIIRIEPIKYTWNEKSGLDTENVYSGFSAQNIQDCIPEAVGQDNKGYLTLSDRPVIAALVNAVKELNSRNNELKAANSSLMDSLTKLATEISVIKVELIQTCPSEDARLAQVLHPGNKGQ